MCCGVVLHAGAASGPRVKYNFNSGWKVLVGDAPGAAAAGFDDAAWKDVTTPYAWKATLTSCVGCT